MTQTPGARRSDPDRLDGWKEIAAYLKRSVRTVQRWEREFSLPVRRIGASGSDVVFAFRHEIDDWLATGPAARARHDDADGTAADAVAPGRPGLARWMWLVVLALTILSAAWAWSNWWTRARAGAASRQPARWEVVDGGLALLDYSGTAVCSIAFGVPTEMHHYEAQPPEARLAVDLTIGAEPLVSKPMVQIVDLDGDGRREVVVAHRAADFRQQSIIAYDDSCRERWRYEAQPAAVFGGTRYEGPYQVLWVKVTKADNRRWAVWASRRHSKYFPSVLQKFDADGRLLGEYWNPGEIDALETGALEGRDSVLIGGVNNEFRLPFAAKYDGASHGGVAPATSDAYRCSSCPSGAAPPQAYVIFPDTDLGVLRAGMRAVSAIRLDHQWVTVEILQNALTDRSPPVLATTSYDLDANLVPVRAEFSSGYELAWRYLFDKGVLHRPFDAAQRAALWNVLVWDGATFQRYRAPASATR